MDVIKERLQAQNILDPKTIKYKNSISAIFDIIKEDGFFGLYRGFFLSLYVYAPYVSLYFSFYEQMKYFFYKNYFLDQGVPMPIILCLIFYF